MRRWTSRAAPFGCANATASAPAGKRSLPVSSFAARHTASATSAAQSGEVRHGTRGGRPDVRLLGGYFVFDSPDAALLVSLPAMVHVRGAERLSVLVRLVGDESVAQRSGRDLVLRRLVEVLLIEALRSIAGEDAPPGSTAFCRHVGQPPSHYARAK